jgi:hypothetical protein
VLIGTVYRYTRDKDPTPPTVDGFPNYFDAVSSPGRTLPLLERGISPIARTSAIDGARRPAILISSSPHKIGSHDTPWQDTFDTDNGHIRYFGDNKSSARAAAASPGNAVLLKQHLVHSSPDSKVRAQAAPLVVFRRVPRLGRVKGFVQFCGFGIVQRVELITQFHQRQGAYFSNDVFDFCILSLKEEDVSFDWSWITVLCSPIRVDT